jgi:large conductance mechanosensitive channel
MNMKKFFAEFLDFIKRGSILDLAVGIIIGGAFNAIVRSLVNDLLMPVIGLIGGTNVSEAKIVLVAAIGETPAVTLNYGSFIQTIIDFLIIAITIFVIVKVATRAGKLAEKARTRKEKATPAEVVVEEKKPTVEELLTDIRDLLNKQD